MSHWPKAHVKGRARMPKVHHEKINPISRRAFAAASGKAPPDYSQGRLFPPPFGIKLHTPCRGTTLPKCKLQLPMHLQGAVDCSGLCHDSLSEDSLAVPFSLPSPIPPQERRELNSFVLGRKRHRREVRICIPIDGMPTIRLPVFKETMTTAANPSKRSRAGNAQRGKLCGSGKEPKDPPRIRSSVNIGRRRTVSRDVQWLQPGGVGWDGGSRRSTHLSRVKRIRKERSNRESG